RSDRDWSSDVCSSDLLFGSIFMNSSWLIGAAPNGGWFGYTPLTTMPYNPGLNIDFWMLGLQILGVSSLAAAFNFATTIINMRARSEERRVGEERRGRR